MKKEDQYCQCTESTAISTGYEDEFGYWQVCSKCGKKIEGEHHYYHGADQDADLEWIH
uniref:hypothetical protein n=1 Tax=Eubacterium cellulosolvens TaxID=29322 RepID=UPI001FA8184F|nr:hypothetical protein [[Eubacterium] cellulosolvens]